MSHTLLPVPAANIPAWQMLQLDPPVVFWNEPIAQGVQIDAPAVENFPTTQIPQALFPVPVAY